MTDQEKILLLKDLQALPKECEWAEFKLNNSNPQDIGEYCSALSNSACYHNQKYGYLVYGIEDGSHKLIGTDFKPLSSKKGNQELENWLATQLNPSIDFQILEFDFEEKHFSIFKIEATNNTPVNFKGETYIRIGSYNQLLDEFPERERKIWKKDDISIFERELSLLNVSEDNLLNLIDYPGYFDLIKFPLPDNRIGILHRLEMDKAVLKVANNYNITNLGAILLSRNIEDFESVSRKATRVIIYEGNNRIKTKKEQIGRKGYAVGFDGLIKYILDQLPVNEIIDRSFRREHTQFPSLAVRELVANAIIHQDFRIKGTSPLIEIFDNRIEITNPGKPLIDPLRFVDHSPESRNEVLARFMRRLNICEERGSGMDKIIYECEKYKLPTPEIIIGDNYTRLILYGPKRLKEMSKNDKTRACYHHACLKYVSGEYMTNQTLRNRFDIDEQNAAIASRIISDTINEKLIKDYDPGNKSRRFTKYVPYWV